MSLDKNIVRRISFLARIRVPEDALEPLSEELSDIIGWVEQLSEVNTEDIDPMTSVAEMTWPRRIDVVNDGNCSADILVNATEPNLVSENPSDGGFFTVPKVVE
jgi:aspartyl-tRNA(Asn)/glutamyl-tRNA(Gln) amidotransferase subunit C